MSTSSVDMKSPKWYVVNKIGMATLCKNFKDAKKEACKQIRCGLATDHT